MEPTKRIPLEEADLETLKHFAELALGIEIKPGTNATQIRGKIAKAMPELKDVPPIPAPPAPVVETAPVVGTGHEIEGENPVARPAAVSRPASKALMHQVNDPRVELTIQKTADKTRSKDVTLVVNGVTVRMQRGKPVNVPYRVYEALNNAVEKLQVPGDEINPATGEPFYVYEDVHSYPFILHRMPSDDEIAAWHAATDSGFQSPQARVAQAA